MWSVSKNAGWVASQGYFSTAKGKPFEVQPHGFFAAGISVLT
jgi:hypothetical protein